eukprot:4333540-Pyramimonas_sp.AAC.1
MEVKTNKTALATWWTQIVTQEKDPCLPNRRFIWHALTWGLLEWGRGQASRTSIAVVCPPLLPQEEEGADGAEIHFFKKAVLAS